MIYTQTVLKPEQVDVLLVDFIPAKNSERQYAIAGRKEGEEHLTPLGSSHAIVPAELGKLTICLLLLDQNNSTICVFPSYTIERKNTGWWVNGIHLQPTEQSSDKQTELLYTAPTVPPLNQIPTPPCKTAPDTLL